MGFEWLRQYQQNLRQSQRPQQWARPPISARFGAGGGGMPGAQYTGAGPDGVVQPQAPVGMAQDGAMEHEGELRIPGPGGTFVADAGSASMLLGRPSAGMPQAGQLVSPQQQQDMKVVEQVARLPGRASGGFTDTDATDQGFPDAATMEGALTATPPPDTKTSDDWGREFMGAGADLTKTAFHPDASAYEKAKVSDPWAATYMGADGNYAKTPYHPDASAYEKAKVSDPWAATYMGADGNYTKSPYHPDNAVPEWQRAGYTDEATWRGAQNAAPPPDSAATTGAEGAGTQPLSQNAAYRNAAMGRLAATMRGGSQAADLQTRRYMDDLAAMNATERAVAEQEAAQGRLGSDVAAARSAMMGRMQGSAMADAAAQGGIKQLEAGEQAARDLASQGLAGMQDDRAQETHDVEMRNSAETDAAGYLQSMGSVAGYDWRGDQNARQKLQKVWESNGNTGPLDEAWADKFVKAASMTELDAVRNTITNSDVYRGAPDVTEYNADGSIKKMGKDLLDGLGETLSLAVLSGGYSIGVDANGNVVLKDPETGEPIISPLGGDGGDGGDGDVPLQDGLAPPNSAGTYAADNDSSYSLGADAFNTTLDEAGEVPSVDVTDDYMQQWAKSHTNEDNSWDPPKTAKEWDDWATKNLVFDHANPDQVRDAMTIVEASDAYTASGGNVRQSMVQLYLQQNGGKLGSVDKLLEFTSNLGNPDTISAYLSSGGTEGELGAQDRTMLKKATTAQSLIPSSGVTDAMRNDESFINKVKAAGFKSVEEAEWYAENVFGRSVSVELTAVGGVPLTYTRGDDAEFRDFTVDKTKLIELARVTTSDMVKNIGKPITINGRSYIPAEESELFVYAAVSSGSNVASGMPGYKVYDVEDNKWVVITPFQYSLTATGPTSGPSIADNTAYAGAGWTAMSIDEGAGSWTPVYAGANDTYANTGNSEGFVGSLNLGGLADAVANIDWSQMDLSSVDVEAMRALDKNGNGIIEASELNL